MTEISNPFDGNYYGKLTTEITMGNSHEIM
jgi:hypothetical protein